MFVAMQCQGVQLKFFFECFNSCAELLVVMCRSALVNKFVIQCGVVLRLQVKSVERGQLLLHFVQKGEEWELIGVCGLQLKILHIASVEKIIILKWVGI